MYPGFAGSPFRHALVRKQDCRNQINGVKIMHGMQIQILEAEEYAKIEHYSREVGGSSPFDFDVGQWLAYQILDFF
jgi:hypothetical protein